MDDQEFQTHAGDALEDLNRRLSAASEKFPFISAREVPVVPSAPLVRDDNAIMNVNTAKNTL